jgi:hypothetical protein
VDKGYLAFLDVLGFSALVSSDHDGKRIESYRDSVKDAIADTEVKSVVFSDSIVLTTDDPRPESLLTIAGACSKLSAIYWKPTLRYEEQSLAAISTDRR